MCSLSRQEESATHPTLDLLAYIYVGLVLLCIFPLTVPSDSRQLIEDQFQDLGSVLIGEDILTFLRNRKLTPG